jgi:hypothetical protein
MTTMPPTSISIARARISSEAMAWTTTAERPTKTTPQEPPTTASASESGTELDTPTPAIASALRK